MTAYTKHSLIILMSIISITFGFLLFANPRWPGAFVCIMFLAAIPFISAMIAMFPEKKNE